jgi:hypothetical protein
VLPRTRGEVPTRNSRRGKMWKARLEDLDVMFRHQNPDSDHMQQSGENIAHRTRSASDSR